MTTLVFSIEMQNLKYKELLYALRSQSSILHEGSFTKLASS